ncbi:MAG: hypothetical protein HGA36_01020 [Candidatus Moranbacteria bacterium]|nr:hypothetical protein [Candidatus Moranbacteria bacterium]
MKIILVSEEACHETLEAVYCVDGLMHFTYTGPCYWLDEQPAHGASNFEPCDGSCKNIDNRLADSMEIIEKELKKFRK